jgi:hypothetical protein
MGGASPRSGAEGRSRAVVPVTAGFALVGHLYHRYRCSRFAKHGLDLRARLAMLDDHEAQGAAPTTPASPGCRRTIHLSAQHPALAGRSRQEDTGGGPSSCGRPVGGFGARSQGSGLRGHGWSRPWQPSGRRPPDGVQRGGG